MRKNSNKIIGTLLILIGLISIIGLIISIVQGNAWNIKSMILSLISIVIGLLTFFEDKSKISVVDVDERTQHLIAKTDSSIIKILFILSGISTITSVIILQFNNHSSILVWFLLSLLLFFIITISKVTIYLYNYYHL